MSDVRIKITADNQQANQALQSTQKQLAATAVAATKVDSSFDKLGKGSSQATNALTNLGRVVQDAPFGFIGIANNINPLLESFQRLKLETGSTQGALKSLAGSLVGGGGLGLAVSAATSVLTVLAMNGFFNTAKEASKAKDEIKKFQDEVNSIGESAAKEQAEVLVLVKALESETTTRKEKVAALKQLQQVNPEYFSGLKLEGDLVNGIAKAYDNYQASILKSVQNKIDSKALEDVLKKINDLRDQEVSRQQFLKIIEKQRVNLQKLEADPALVKQLDIYKEMVVPVSSLAELEKRRDIILERIASRGFEGEIKFDTEKAKKDVETISDVIAKLRRDINFLSEKELQLGTDETKEKIQAIEQAIERLVRDFKVNPKDTIVQKLFGEIQDLIAKLDDIRIEPIKIKTAIEVKDEIDKAAKEAKDRADKLFGNVKIKPIPINISLREGEFTQKMRAFYKMLNEMNERATEGLKSTFTNAFASIGNSIAESLQSGADFGKAIFGNLFKVLGAGLKQLGEAMIGIGTAKIALEKFKFAPGIATVVAGIATVALGALLQNALPGFADGVRGFRGGLAVVGERGPELVRLPSGSDVIPNYRMNNMAASGQQVFIPKMKLRGKDIFVSFNRTEDNYSRNGL